MKRFIGTRGFYRHLMTVAIPIMIQTGITNFVSMLDNIMVGQVGTNQMSGVAIVNQLIFVFSLCIFGGISGAGIFTAQFYGQGNTEGVQYTFRFKLLIVTVLTATTIGIFLVFGPQLIQVYLHQGSSTTNAAATLIYAKQYLTIMYFDMIPFALAQAYAGTLRECGETITPMKAGIAAVLVNLCLNYILIYGKLGAPALGVRGAAIATVISRFVELGIIVFWTHHHTQKASFIIDVYRNFYIPSELMKRITIKGFPLLLNETLWASGQAYLLQNYSIRGLDVVAALNISGTISQVFNVVFIALGSAIAIILGQELGAAKMDTIKQKSAQLIFFSVIACILSGALLLLIAPFFPRIYNTTASIQHLATLFIVISAFCMPMYSFENATYFTLRSGGKTGITFLFDSGFVWCAIIPVVFALTHFTSLSIISIYIICQLTDIIKCTIGYLLVKKGVWINDLTVF